MWNLYALDNLKSFDIDDFYYLHMTTLDNIFKLQESTNYMIKSSNIGVSSFYDVYYTDIYETKKIYEQLDDAYFIEKKILIIRLCKRLLF